MTQAQPSATPEFRRVAQRLRDDVTGGVYAPGQRLPAAADLAERLGTNRSVTERAIRLAAAEGLLTTRKGSGAYVARILKRIPRRAAAPLGRQDGGEADGTREAVEAELRDMGLAPRYFPTVSTERAPQDFAALLGVKRSGKNALVRETRVFAVPVDAQPTDPGTPVELIRTYLPLDIAAGTALEQPGAAPLDIRGRLAELGHRPTEFTETIDVRPPLDDEAQFLGLDTDNRVVQLTHSATAGDRTVEISVSVFPAHLWSFSYRWTAS
ncbi:GntR family transcriptional regulator [Streptomyces sp. NPDC055036]